MPNTDPIDALTKTYDNSSISGFIRLDDAKKYKTTKRSINSICNALALNTLKYDPAKTIVTIEQYIKTKQRMTRILYSEISSFLFNLDEEKRTIFLTNVENLLIYALGHESEISPDAAKITIKIYDHTQLVNYQIESMGDTFANRLKDSKVELKGELKGIQKEYITILGIFAAIVLAFVGSFTFSTSVLNNIGATNIFQLIAIASIIGIVFYNIIAYLISFLKVINDKVEIGEKGKKKKDIRTILTNVLLAAILVASLYMYSYTNNAELEHNKMVTNANSSIITESNN